MIKPENKREMLTESEYKILITLVDFVRVNEHQPSMHELANLSGFAAVHKQLKNIEKKGYIYMTGVVRNIKIAEDLLR